MKKAVVVLASVLTVACSSAHKAETSQMSQATDKPDATSAAATAAAAAAAAQLAELNAEVQRLAGESDYFDFNKAAIKPAYRAVIEKQAEFLKNHKNDVVTLQGNADERGSEKYNFALGERRATAVMKALQALGVPAAQITTVSFGKDKPRLLCHEEKCWKENRRVDFEHTLG